MKLYHGSNCKITLVNLAFSREYMDFGKGFYLTPDFQRAVTMANRSVELRGSGTPEINPFIFNRSSCPKDMVIKEFKSNTWEWAEFVMHNRDKLLIPPYNHGYDIVIGPVADSRVDAVITAYKKEFGHHYLRSENLKELAVRLKYPGSIYIQYCFCSEKALNFLFRD
ncbi:MAG: DUF3990 domain-containing protein [Bacteroides sp.]|nr:DUF3990 domain-containing protein [Bacteroides sp.]